MNREDDAYDIAREDDYSSQRVGEGMRSCRIS